MAHWFSDVLIIALFWSFFFSFLRLCCYPLPPHHQPHSSSTYTTSNYAIDTSWACDPPAGCQIALSIIIRYTTDTLFYLTLGFSSDQSHMLFFLPVYWLCLLSLLDLSVRYILLLLSRELGASIYLKWSNNKYLLSFWIPWCRRCGAWCLVMRLPRRSLCLAFCIQQALPRISNRQYCYTNQWSCLA